MPQRNPRFQTWKRGLNYWGGVEKEKEEEEEGEEEGSNQRTLSGL